MEDSNITKPGETSVPISPQREVRLLLNGQDNAVIFINDLPSKREDASKIDSSQIREESTSDSKLTKTEIRLLVNKHDNVHKTLCSLKGLWVLLLGGLILNLRYNAIIEIPTDIVMIVSALSLFFYFSLIMYFGWCLRKFEHALDCRLKINS